MAYKPLPPGTDPRSFVTIDSRDFQRAINDFEKAFDPHVVTGSLKKAAKMPIRTAVKAVVDEGAKKAGVKPAMVKSRIGVWLGPSGQFRAQIYVRGARQRSERFSYWNLIRLYTPGNKKLSLRVSPPPGSRRGGLVRGKRGYRFGKHNRPNAFYSGKYRGFFVHRDDITMHPTVASIASVIAPKTTGEILNEAANSTAISRAMADIIERTFKGMDEAARSATYRNRALRARKVKEAGMSAAKFIAKRQARARILG